MNFMRAQGGPPGPPGPAGPPGPGGPAGAAGADGAMGPAGPAGAVGADGAVGPAGPAGAAGAAGAAGVVGPAGPAGAAGAVGPAGPAGAVGPAGAAGPAGPVGAAGAAGAAGAVGPVGPAGPAGAIGPAGAAGAIGPAGAAGADGAAGAAGPNLPRPTTVGQYASFDMFPLATTTGTMPVQTIFFTPSWITASTAVDALILEVVTAAGAGTSSLVFAIYASSGGKPGARTANFSASPIPFSGTGLQILATGGVVIIPGLIFVACLWTGTAVTGPVVRMNTGVHPAISGTALYSGSTATGYKQTATSMPLNAAPALITPVNVPTILFQIG